MATPSSPSAASISSKPALVSRSRRICRLSSWSSTTRMRLVMRACHARRRSDRERDPEGRALARASDSTQIVPPCISTMRLAIASPSPVPPFLLGAASCRPAGTPRRSAPGRRRRCPGRCRAPRARKCRRPASARDRRPRPASVNLMALPTRLSSTWVRRRSSPRPIGRSSATLDRQARASSRAASGSTAATHRLHDLGRCE